MASPLMVGAEGQIGRALLAALPHAQGTTRRPSAAGQWFVDLAADESHWVLPASVSEAYLCAAITALEACRQDPTASAFVNVTQTVKLAQRLIALGAFIVFLSTNLVFDGSHPRRLATEPPCPTTEYGRQKAEAERALESLGEAVAIVRLTKVITPNMALLARWRAALEQGQTIRPFSDLVMAPLPLPFVVQALTRIGARRHGGVFQLSGERDITYAEAAEWLAARLGANPKLVQPITSVEAGVALEAIPAHTTLDDTRARQMFGLQPPSSADTLEFVAKP